MRRFAPVLATAILLAALGSVPPAMPTHGRVPVRLAPAVHLVRPASAIQG